MKKLLFASLLLALIIAMVGCSSAAEPPAESPAKPDTSTDGAPPDEVDLSYLTGTWDVVTTLTDIDNSAMTMAADQPGAQWSCAVEGSTMRLLTDQHEYSGALTPQNEEAWRYDATATFVDESGYTWTSTIRVQATQQADNAFVGTMEGSIDSDAEGHLYTATWDIVGRRL